MVEMEMMVTAEVVTVVAVAARKREETRNFVGVE